MTDDQDPHHHYRVADDIAQAWLDSWHLAESCRHYQDSRVRCIFCVSSVDALIRKRADKDGAQRANVAYLVAMGKL